MKASLLLLYGKTNRHLGLWNDLGKDVRVVMRCTDFIPFLRRFRFLRKLILKCIGFWGLPYRHKWHQHRDFLSIIPEVKHLLIIDGALNNIDICELKTCRKLNPNLKISLYLINSLKADSPLIRGVIPKMNQFAWDAIYTFDPDDAKEYGFIFSGFNYYSKHEISLNEKIENDVYFVGGLKGGREKLIYDTYSYLISHNVKCLFDLMAFDDIDFAPVSDIRFMKKWRPYEDVLLNVSQSKCILEITQEGQKGATLRFFEAVIMNKKLLTNNPMIVDYPFYNPKWMKVYKKLEDIDWEWIKKDAHIDYGYNDEFSPTHLIDRILRQ